MRPAAQTISAVVARISAIAPCRSGSSRTAWIQDGRFCTQKKAKITIRYVGVTYFMMIR